MEPEVKARHSQAGRRRNSGNEGTTARASQRRQSEEEEHQVSINSHRNEASVCKHSSRHQQRRGSVKLPETRRSTSTNGKCRNISLNRNLSVDSVGLESQGRVQRKNSEEILKPKNQQNFSLHDKLQRRQENINQTENLSNQAPSDLSSKLDRQERRTTRSASQFALGTSSQDISFDMMRSEENATSNPRGAVRRHSLLSQTSIKRLFKWKARSSDPSSRRQSDTNEASALTNNHYFFSSEEEPSLVGGEPYNTTMQCYCGQNSCPLCNLLLNLQITNTGID